MKYINRYFQQCTFTSYFLFEKILRKFELFLLFLNSKYEFKAQEIYHNLLLNVNYFYLI